MAGKRLALAIKARSEGMDLYFRKTDVLRGRPLSEMSSRSDGTTDVFWSQVELEASGFDEALHGDVARLPQGAAYPERSRRQEGSACLGARSASGAWDASNGKLWCHIIAMLLRLSRGNPLGGLRYMLRPTGHHLFWATSRLGS